jgi:ammonia channel protein AmtB
MRIPYMILIPMVLAFLGTTVAFSQPAQGISLAALIGVTMLVCWFGFNAGVVLDLQLAAEREEDHAQDHGNFEAFS